MGNEPATRADLNALEQRIDGKLDALEKRIDQKIEASENRLEGKIDASEQRVLDRLTEVVRDTETRMLKAFYAYAEATDKRLGQADANTAIFFSRIGNLEGRVREIEKRLNIPPAA